MSTDRSELHELLDALPGEQVPFAAADLRRRARRRTPRHQDRPLAWIGMIENGPEDASSPERIDQELARGFGRN
ncbi:MAG: hypothetical protein ACRDTJ_09845 [Pseudonocardiaceae bacterium]